MSTRRQYRQREQTSIVINTTMKRTIEVRFDDDHSTRLSRDPNKSIALTLILILRRRLTMTYYNYHNWNGNTRDDKVLLRCFR